MLMKLIQITIMVACHKRPWPLNCAYLAESEGRPEEAHFKRAKQYNFKLGFNPNPKTKFQEK